MLSLILLISLFFFGVERGGAKSWYILGPVSFQPSEFAKLCTALFLAKFLSINSSSRKNYNIQEKENIENVNLDLVDDIKEDFCFLYTGHWLPGNFGEDRKNTALLIKTFLETFNGPGRKKPALVLKTNEVNYSLLDREDTLRKINEIRTVHTECARKVARHLAHRYGLFVGISAGANVMAAFQWLRDNDKRNAITILCDRGERYFSCL